MLKIKEKQPTQPLFISEEQLSFKEEQKFSFSYYIRIKTLDNQSILNKMITLAEENNVAVKDIHIEKAEMPNHTDIFLITHPIIEENAIKLVRILSRSDFVKEAKKIRILGN